jgi:hypothetical protein
MSDIFSVPVAEVGEVKVPWTNPIPMPVLGGVMTKKVFSGVIPGATEFGWLNWRFTVPCCETQPVME